MRIRLIVILCGGMILIAAGCQSAATPAPIDNVIRYGDTAQGSLTPDDEQPRLGAVKGCLEVLGEGRRLRLSQATVMLTIKQ